MKVISFLNFKGGVGKTTSAFLLFDYLTTIKNKKVLLIDFDNQLNLTLLNKCKFDFTFIDYLNADNKKEIGNSFIKNSFVCGGIGINDLNIKKDIINKFLNHFKNYFDFVIFDLSPFENKFNINILSICDIVLTPLNADLFALNSALKLNKYFNIVNNKKNKLNICFYNLFVKNSRFEKDIINDFNNKHFNNFKNVVFLNDFVIKKSLKIKEYITFNKNIFNLSDKNIIKNELMNLFNCIYENINK